MTGRETKTVATPEIRFAEDAEGQFTGYASVFGEPDSYGDTIKSGAFKKSLSKRAGPVAMFWNHDPDRPIGVWSDLTEDARGLKATGKLVMDTMQGREAHALLKAGAVNGLSIGFRAKSSERGSNGGRVLTEIELVEISLVSLPAASKARVTSVKHSADPAVAAFTAACRTATEALKG